MDLIFAHRHAVGVLVRSDLDSIESRLIRNVF